MNCTDIIADLFDFHLGEISDQNRNKVEEHLRQCTSCLNEFLFLKRHTETDFLSEAPSSSMREKLRISVAEKVTPQPEKRWWFRWEAPVAFTFAGAAVVAALLFSYSISETPGSMPLSFSDNAIEPVFQILE